MAAVEKLTLEHKNERINEINMSKLKKNYSYEWEQIDEEYKSNAFIWLDTRLDLDKEKKFNLWKNDFNLSKNLHFTDHKHIHYRDEENNCIPFLLEIEYICGITDRGEKEDRKHYFKSSSFLQTSYLWEIFAEIETKMMETFDIEYDTIIDSGKFQIDSSKKIPVSQVLYLKNVIVAFEKAESVNVRKREKNKIVARIIAGEVLLNKNV